MLDTVETYKLLTPIEKTLVCFMGDKRNCFEEYGRIYLEGRLYDVYKIEYEDTFKALKRLRDVHHLVIHKKNRGRWYLNRRGWEIVNRECEIVF